MSVSCFLVRGLALWPRSILFFEDSLINQFLVGLCILLQKTHFVSGSCWFRKIQCLFGNAYIMWHCLNLHVPCAEPIFTTWMTMAYRPAIWLRTRRWCARLDSTSRLLCSRILPHSSSRSCMSDASSSTDLTQLPFAIYCRVFPIQSAHYTWRLCRFLLSHCRLRHSVCFSSYQPVRNLNEAVASFSRWQVVDRIEKESGIKLRDGYTTVENARFRTLFTLKEFLVFVDRRKYSDKRLAEVPPCTAANSF